MSKRLVDYTDAELLLELLRRQKLHRGPFKVTWSTSPLNAVIGIGKDHHADIYIDDEDHEMLKKEVERVRSGAE